MSLYAWRNAQFWDRAIPEPNTGCWLWMGPYDHNGYGFAQHAHRRRAASRIAYIIAVGDPGALHVLHRCDTPACINPGHLFLGTHRDNMADMKRKGRAASVRGEAHGNARYSEAQVAEVRRLRGEGFSYSEIERRVGVGRRYACALAKGHWRVEAQT